MDFKLQEKEGTEVPEEEKESTDEEIEEFDKDIPKKEGEDDEEI